MNTVANEFVTHIERPPSPLVFPTHWPIAPRGVTRQLECIYNAGLRESPGYAVTSFRELVGCISELASNNSHLNLYYRGQDFDYKDRNSRSKIYPNLYRPKMGKSYLHPSTIQKRIAATEAAIDRMRKNHRELGLPATVLSHHDEYYLALLQHYEVRHTPFVDITVSLRVAASFALAKHVSEGILYVVHLPLPTGSISHFVDANMVLVRLQSVCPAAALRPHYQEGYLIGQLRSGARKLVGDNLAKSMIGKYRLLNADGQFWDKDFSPIPQNALLPTADEFRDRLVGLLSDLKPAD